MFQSPDFLYLCFPGDSFVACKAEKDNDERDEQDSEGGDDETKQVEVHFSL